MRIRKATAAECEERDRQTFAAWGDRLTQSQFLTRERKLRAHSWAQGAMETWLAIGIERAVGARSSIKDGVLASCETFRMTSLLADGTPGLTYAFASVFTEDRLRGQGFASGLLTGVVERLVEENPDIQAFLLYSEVGAGIYERVGFERLPSFEWRLPVPANLEVLLGGQVEVVPDNALAELVAEYASLQRGFRVLPSASQLEWFWAREEIYADLLKRPRPLAHSARSGQAFAVWMADYKSDSLRALIFRGSEGTSALLADAFRVAQKLGLSELRIWKTPLAGPLGESQRLLVREDALAMIRPVQKLLNLDEVPRALWV